MKKTTRRNLAILFLIFVAVYVVYLRPLQRYYHFHHIDIDGTYLMKPINVADFDLQSGDHNHFTKNNFMHRWTFVYFGFTNCGMVCPTTLNALNKMYQLLEKNIPSTEMPQVLFISVDPERDSIEKIDAYVKSFNPHFIGAKTTDEKTLILEKQFHIAAERTQDNQNDANSYTIEHSPEILLINPEARVQAYFSYPHQPEQLAKEYQAILTQQTNFEKNN